VTLAPGQRILDIVLMDFCNYCQFQANLKWSSVSMDFITDLPSSRYFNVIFVFVDRLTKMVHFVPNKKTITGEEIAKLFVNNVYRYRGLHDDIISDQGPQFVSKFWRSLFEILKMDIKLSSAFHPQTDGQMEHVNQVLDNT
jgi:hypothetical protein